MFFSPRVLLTIIPLFSAQCLFDDVLPQQSEAIFTDAHYDAAGKAAETDKKKVPHNKQKAYAWALLKGYINDDSILSSISVKQSATIKAVSAMIEVQQFGVVRSVLKAMLNHFSRSFSVEDREEERLQCTKGVLGRLRENLKNFKINKRMYVTQIMPNTKNR